MTKVIELNWPKDYKKLKELHSGDLVIFSGDVYTARDAAHKRLVDLLSKGEATPFDVSNSAIYYAGPTPCPPGRVIGSVGPTTSERMDIYKEDMMKAGMKIMIGKGACAPEVKDLCEKYGAVYFAATGGVAALSAQSIKANELVAWKELGAEAVRRLTMEKMSFVVINDIYGNDFYSLVFAEKDKK